MKIGLLFCALFFGQWVLNDLVHFPGGGFGLLIASGGIWWLLKPSKPVFEKPVSVQGWIRRCREVLKQFEEFREEVDSLDVFENRIRDFEEITSNKEPQTIAIVISSGLTFPEKRLLESFIEVPNKLKFFWADPLPINDNSWTWPNSIKQKDALLYILPIPLRAADLLWLEQLPSNQPTWLMIPWADTSSWNEQFIALKAQLPERWKNSLFRWTSKKEDMDSIFEPIRNILGNSTLNKDRTKQRLLEDLHTKWQSELEQLRRLKFNKIQQRSQWIVAGTVFASPVPSTDILALAVVNGLMVKEMGKIWKCSWRPETLQAVAKCLAVAAVGQGVVEWSGQALVSFAKLDGSSWLAAGAFQAISAAYLTRVVGRSMADWLALNNGVSEPDLELLKLQASKLIANAAEEEKLDWSRFIQQAKDWIKENNIIEKKSLLEQQA